jgi:prepilin-type processing-associated H-X9-DG protein
VSADDNGFGPVFNESGDVADEDGFSEDSSVKVVSDSSIGAFPHFFKLELFDSGFVGGNGGALDANFAFFDGSG